VTPSTVAPPVMIEQVSVNGAPRDLSRHELDVPPGSSAVEIHYTGLSFSAPEQVRFRYKLAGLDDEWTEAGTRRSVTFSHLPPGRYAFAVTAANADGVWNETATRIGLRVVPPFYRTSWFAILMFLGMGALAFAVHERRVRRLKRAKAAQEEFSRRLIESQEAERKRIAAELHDSLSQTLAVIKNRALRSLQTPGDPQRALDQMGEIVEAATHALDEVKEISHDLRPHHLDRLGLTKAIEAMLDAVLVSRGIRVSTEIDALDGVLAAGVEINVYRIAQEAVNNIVKHAAATEVRVAIRRQGRSIGITIEDNGRGFVPGAAPSAGPGGYGLLGIAERARLLGTEPVIQSAPGRGTTLRLTLAT
jgi:signal transduction histidine kinase